MKYLDVLLTAFPGIWHRAPLPEFERERLVVRLGLSIPKELARLYAETDGLYFDWRYIVEPLPRVVKLRKDFTEDAAAGRVSEHLERLLVFGDEGDGNQYGYRVEKGTVDDSGVYVWSHETDTVEFFAATLEEYLKQRREAYGAVDPRLLDR